MSFPCKRNSGVSRRRCCDAKNHHRTSKLSPLFKGTFRICEENDPSYVLDIDGQKKMLHADQLKLILRGGQINGLDLCVQGSEQRIDYEDPDGETDHSDEQPGKEQEFVGQDGTPTAEDQESQSQVPSDNLKRSRSGRESRLPPHSSNYLVRKEEDVEGVRI